MKLNKIVAASLAAMLLLTAAGCGGSTAPQAPATPANSASPAATPATDKPVELEFYVLKPETVTVLEDIISDFSKENPNIKVTLTSVADPGTVLLTRISTDDMPDMLHVYPAEEKYKVMFEDGLMVDMTNEPFMTNVADSMLKMAAYNGKQYALPMTLSSYGIYYRTDLFEKFSIPEPKTYPELLEACKKLQANGLDAFALPNKDVGNVAQRLERLTGVLNNHSNDEFKKIAAGEMKVEDSKTIRTFAEMCVEIAKYSTKDSLGMDYESAVADLVNGKAGMMFSGTWMLSTMRAANPDIAVKLIPAPSPLSDATMVPVNIDSSFAVSSSCKNPAEALKFIEFLSRTEVAQKYYEADGNVNMIKGVNYDKEPHMYMKGLMDKGQMFLTQVNFWPNGLREEMRAPAQQLFVDSNVDNFVKAFGDAIVKLYNR
ncbi:MAG: extracellular solute-binding protein [Angelakisella sp.]